MTSPKSSKPPKLHQKLRLPFALKRVYGDSMLPTLKAGQIIVVRQWFVRAKPNQVVVIRHNGLDKIKRIDQIHGRKVYVLGDNPKQSTDSREFGWLPKNNIKAVLILSQVAAQEND